jgi:hypothetical protein
VTPVVVAYVAAGRLAAKNRRELAHLRSRADQLAGVNEVEEAKLQWQRTAVFADVCRPFAEAFSQLRGVDLAELRALDTLPGATAAQVSLPPLRAPVTAAIGALGVGAAAGAGVGAVTFASVGTMATASTGTAIASLKGAAATSATLAWLGGGSIAVGGGGVAAGTLILGGIVAAPVIITIGAVAEFQGRKARRAQQAVVDELAHAGADLCLDEARCAAVRERSRDLREILRRLHESADPGVRRLRAAVDDGLGYEAFDPGQRADLAVTVGLVTTIVTVLQTPLLDDQGTVSDLSAAVMVDARARADAAARGTAAANAGAE